MALSLFVVILLSCYAQATIDFRIIRGTKAPDEIAPYIVSLSHNGRHICGGSILNKRWLVTAAHCFKGVKPSEVKIRMGSKLHNASGVVVEIEDVIIHELRQEHTVNGIKYSKNDIGLIKVATDIPFSNKIQAIKLTNEDTPAGLSVLATGWGKTEKEYTPTKLQMVKLTTISTHDCQEKLSRVNLGVTPTNLCTITTRGQGTCKGDSGGPLVFNNLLVGITSFGYPCAWGYPDIFTRVHSYVDWIVRNIAVKKLKIMEKTHTY